MQRKTFRLQGALLALGIFTFLARAALGAAGDLYVGDLATGIFRITPAGVVTRFVGGFDAYGIAFNARAIGFSASSDAKKIVRLAGDGSATDFATGLGDPLGLAFDHAGNLYAADFTAATIWKFTADGLKTSFATGIPHADGIAFDPTGNLFVTSYNDGRVTKISPSGAKTTFATGLTGPVGLACDGAGNLFVAERDGGRISRFSAGGTKTTFSSSVASPYGLAFDAGGTLFVADQFSSTIYRLDAQGAKTQFATIIGEAGFMTFEPATGALRNVSTRLRVLTGENVLIGGFIITGNDSKRLAIRGIGPSLAAAGVPDCLQDPMLDLHDSTGAIIGTNDDWRQTQESELQASGLAPTDSREAAMIVTLAPGAYTAIASGRAATIGVGSVEVYDLSAGANSKLANISTRGFVDVGDNVMIGGFIIGEGNGAKVLVRAIGPSLAGFGIANPLHDPTLALHDSNGVIIASNDNWKDTQEIGIQGTTLAPSNDAEAAILISLAPGAYTAIVSGKNGETGVGLVEAYNL